MQKFSGNRLSPLMAADWTNNGGLQGELAEGQEKVAWAGNPQAERLINVYSAALRRLPPSETNRRLASDLITQK